MGLLLSAITSFPTGERKERVLKLPGRTFSCPTALRHLLSSYHLWPGAQTAHTHTHTPDVAGEAPLLPGLQSNDSSSAVQSCSAPLIWMAKDLPSTRFAFCKVYLTKLIEITETLSLQETIQLATLLPRYGPLIRNKSKSVCQEELHDTEPGLWTGHVYNTGAETDRGVARCCSGVLPVSVQVLPGYSKSNEITAIIDI